MVLPFPQCRRFRDCPRLPAESAQTKDLRRPKSECRPAIHTTVQRILAVQRILTARSVQTVRPVRADNLQPGSRRILRGGRVFQMRQICQILWDLRYLSLKNLILQFLLFPLLFPLPLRLLLPRLRQRRNLRPSRKPINACSIRQLFRFKLMRNKPDWQLKLNCRRPNPLDLRFRTGMPQKRQRIRPQIRPQIFLRFCLRILRKNSRQDRI